MKKILTPLSCLLLLTAASALAATDSDRDGVADSSDICPYTPPKAKVDAYGCALDADYDGIADGLDTCPQSPFGIPVDTRGCGREESRTAVASAAPAPTAAPAPAPDIAVVEEVAVALEQVAQDLETSPPAPVASAAVAAGPSAPAAAAPAATVTPAATPRASTRQERIVRVAPMDSGRFGSGLPSAPSAFALADDEPVAPPPPPPPAPATAVAPAAAAPAPAPVPEPPAPAPVAAAPAVAVADEPVIPATLPPDDTVLDPGLAAESNAGGERQGANPDHAELLPLLNDQDALLDAIGRRNREREAAEERASQERLSRILDERTPLSEESVFGSSAAKLPAAAGRAPARKPAAAQRATPPRKAAAAAPRVMPRNTERLFADVPFKAGSARLDPDASKTLASLSPELARVMKGLPNLRVEIIGHADASEGARAERLAGERALAVNAYLIGQGVPPGRIQRLNKGSASPRVVGGDGSGNRLVEIYTYPR